MFQEGFLKGGKIILAGLLCYLPLLRINSPAFMEITNRKTAYKGFNQIEKLTLSHNGETLEREQYKTKNAVAALVYDTEKKVYVLVKQFRIGAEKELLEIVAGYVDKTDPDHETAIRR